MVESVFNVKLKELRESKGLSVADLATRLGFKERDIIDFESAKKEPRLRDVIQFADFFEVTLEYIIKGKS